MGKRRRSSSSSFLGPLLKFMGATTVRAGIGVARQMQMPSRYIPPELIRQGPFDYDLERAKAWKRDRREAHLDEFLMCCMFQKRRQRFKDDFTKRFHSLSYEMQKKLLAEFELEYEWDCCSDQGFVCLPEFYAIAMYRPDVFWEKELSYDMTNFGVHSHCQYTEWQDAMARAWTARLCNEAERKRPYFYLGSFRQYDPFGDRYFSYFMPDPCGFIEKSFPCPGGNVVGNHYIIDHLKYVWNDPDTPPDFDAVQFVDFIYENDPLLSEEKPEDRIDIRAEMKKQHLHPRTSKVASQTPEEAWNNG